MVAWATAEPTEVRTSIGVCECAPRLCVAHSSPSRPQVDQESWTHLQAVYETMEVVEGTASAWFHERKLEEASDLRTASLLLLETVSHLFGTSPLFRLPPSVCCPLRPGHNDEQTCVMCLQVRKSCVRSHPWPGAHFCHELTTRCTDRRRCSCCAVSRYGPRSSAV